MKHHVLLVVSTLDGTGPGRIMSDLARGLSSEGHQVMLVATHGEVSGDLTRGLPPTSWDNLSMKSMFDIRGARKLERIARSFRPTVIHTRTFRADLVARWVARRLGVPLINNIVNVHPNDTFALHGTAKGSLVMLLYKATMPRGLSVVVNARALVEPTARVLRMDPGDVRVIHDGIDMQPFQQAVATGSPHTEGVTFVTSARLHPQKGLDVLIEAAALVIRELPDARFLIAGTGPLQEELEELTVRRGVEDPVDLLGWCDDMPSLLRGADVYVLPSRYEGLPGSVIEAMAA